MCKILRISNTPDRSLNNYMNVGKSTLFTKIALITTYTLYRLILDWAIGAFKTDLPSTGSCGSYRK